MVIDGVLAPDARVSIDALALALGVSHTPVREALAHLEGDGLVAKRAHGRYWTTPMLAAESFEHLYAARLRLEPFAAGEAAARLTPTDIAALRQTLGGMEQAGFGGDYRQYGRFSSEDARFHAIIAAGAGNPFIADAIERLHSHVQLSRLYASRGVIDAPEALADHRAILAALERQEARAAALTMRQHIERSRERLRPLVRPATQNDPCPAPQ